MSELPSKSTLLQDLNNIEILRAGSKLTEKEHDLMKAGITRLAALVISSYPDQPATIPTSFDETPNTNTEPHHSMPNG